MAETAWTPDEQHRMVAETEPDRAAALKAEVLALLAGFERLARHVDQVALALEGMDSDDRAMKAMEARALQFVRERERLEGALSEARAVAGELFPYALERDKPRLLEENPWLIPFAQAAVSPPGPRLTKRAAGTGKSRPGTVGTAPEGHTAGG